MTNPAPAEGGDLGQTLAQEAPGDAAITNTHRHQLTDALAAALLLIYAGSRAKALSQLGSQVAALDLPPSVNANVLAFARDRADAIQRGVNERVAGATDAASVAAEITDYNERVLQPYLTSWARHQGLLAAYRETARPGGKTAAEVRADGAPQLWVWTQNTDFVDDCTDANDASPAPLADLESIAGTPPAHPRCQCTLDPESAPGT